MKPGWDIYKQQPVLLHHPSLSERDNDVFVAAVTKVKKGIIWWSADYFISEALSGQPGSGFAEHPLSKRPKYIKDGNCWIIDDKEDGLYRFCLPSREMIEYYEQHKKYIPTVEWLIDYAKETGRL